MIKKRLTFLMVCVYLLTVLLPQPILWASEYVPHEGLSLQAQAPRTTGGQIIANPEQDQTTSAVLVVVDQLITQAQLLIREAPIGTTPGSYRIQDREQLERVWLQAKEERAHAEAAEVALAIAGQLREAIMAFKATRIVDVGQLGLAAYYYGHMQDASSWKAAVWFDMNLDGTVDGEDLQRMVKKS